jgi:hypothetical protein
MKSPSLIPLLALSVFPFSLSGQTVTIADWQGNKSGAISMTFDDALSGHWSHADPIMTAAGVRGTFYVITGVTDWNSARTAALNGHEIGSHSTVDATLQNDTNAGLKMQQSHDAIETEIGAAIPGYQCHTIAWPYGYRRLDVVNDPLYHDLYLSARNAGNALLATNSYNSANTASWWKYGEGTYGEDHFFVIGDALMQTTTSLTTFESQLDLVAAQNGWTVFTYHAIETGGYQNIPAATFTDQVAALATRSDDLYIAPVGEVIRYIRQRDAASATVTSNDGTTLILSLTDSLDDSVYNIPLTLVFDAPSGWTSVEAVQDGAPVAAALVEGTVVLNAVPDAGDITVTGAGSPEIVVPPVSILPLSPGTAQLSWESGSGLQYEVLTSTTLSGWSPMDPAIIVTGDGSVQTQEVPVSGPIQFYQLSVTPVP